jgi:hypothetical protein
VALRVAFSVFITLKYLIAEFELIKLRVLKHEFASSLFVSHNLSLTCDTVSDDQVKASRLGFRFEPGISVVLF